MIFKTLVRIFKNKCPKCGSGNVFESENPFVNTSKTNTTCSHCHLKFEKEPGFFYGAMYITYMFNVALFIAFVVAYSLWFEALLSGWLIMFIYILVTLLFTPFYIRLSRSIWLNIWL